ncbi:MAG: DUF2812 domain-containing protein [Oscillospiraceae bacterium]
MSKYVKRVIPFESSDIPAIQKWLEDMAQQGLFYSGCGIFCAKFEKGEPRETRYRLDFCDVVACDIPDEKKEMYEKNGWQVVDEFKSDLIVLCTDDPEAPEIYTEHSNLVKPLKKLAAKHKAYWILFLLMFMFSQIGGPLNVLISGKGSIVSNLINIGTAYYCLIVLMTIVLLLEFVVHLRRWRHLKKLIKDIEKGGELPTGEKYKTRFVVGSILVPLSIPIIILWGLHLILPYGYRTLPPVRDGTDFPFPTAEELGIECVAHNMYASEGSDLLAGRIIRFDQSAPPEDDEQAGDEIFQYDVEYYDMRRESFAKEFIEGQIDEMINYDREAYRLRMERISADDRLDYEWDGFMPEYTVTKLEKSGADVCIVHEKYEDSDTAVTQFMYVRLGNQLVKVIYQGPDELTDFVDQYIEYLKSAE